MNAPVVKQRSKYVYLGVGILCGLAAAWLFGLLSSEPAPPITDADHGTVHEEPTMWTCSMDPQIQQPEPGLCPLCGMPLIPVGSGGEDDSPRSLVMSEAAKKLAEIETAPVERRFVEHALRLVGKIEYDETRLKYITAWFPGRLERLFVDYTGTPVKAGEHLVEIYSPELLSDQEALLQTRRAVMDSPPASDAAVQRSRTESLERARNRLRLLGLTDSQIEQIEEQGSPSERITFYSPIDGVVIHKSAFKGDYVQTGSRIFTIADLSHVWVKMDAYESDLQWLRYGQEVAFRTVAHPGEEFHGRVAVIDPYLNEETRTVKVRVNLDNSHGKLKPGMLVRGSVRIKSTEAGQVMDTGLSGKWMCSMHPEIVKDTPGDCDLCEMPLVTTESLGYAGEQHAESLPPLVIPASSVLLTGTRAVIYVSLPNREKPTFEGREIELGPRLGDFYVVKSGLSEGESIVVNGNFKIDSALQIMAKPSMMSPDGGSPAPGHAHSGTSKQDEAHSRTAKPAGEDEAAQSAVIEADALAALLPHYRELAAALASDSLEDAQKAARATAEAAMASGVHDIHSLANEAGEAVSIEDIRKRFDQLSEILIGSLETHSAPGEDLYLAFCPMAFGNRGARWLQWNDDILNPYFGDMMLKCGTIEKTFPASGEQ